MTKRFIAKINIFTVYYLNGSMHHFRKKTYLLKKIGRLRYDSGSFCQTLQLEFLDVVLAGSLASQLIRI